MDRQRAKGERFRALHEGRALRHPQPVGRRLGTGLRRARLPGARDDELRLRLHPRPGGRRRDAGGGRRARRPRSTRRPTCPCRSTSRTDTATRPRMRPARSRGCGCRRGRRLDRGLRRREPAVRLDHAVERVAAAVEAARALPFPFTLTARAENHIRGNPDLDDTIARLQAFEAAGADVLYAPGLATVEEIRRVCEAVDEAGERPRAPAADVRRDRRRGRAAGQRRREPDLDGRRRPGRGSSGRAKRSATAAISRCCGPPLRSLSDLGIPDTSAICVRGRRRSGRTPSARRIAPSARRVRRTCESSEPATSRSTPAGGRCESTTSCSKSVPRRRRSQPAGCGSTA